MSAPRPRILIACLIGLAVTWALPAEAQDCGSWREPVLCQGRLQIRGPETFWQDFDPSRGLQLEPGTSIEIELTGRDQFGRTFPAGRLALDFDDRDCDRYLNVEDQGEGRLRIETGLEGRCRLDVWVPGNLNFAWRLELEIARGPRTGYSEREARFIAERLFRALLGREGDAAGVSAATAEIARGNLESQIRAMLRSEEFNSKLARVDMRGLLEQFYQGLLGRTLDSVGVRTFEEDMSRRRWTEVLLSIIRSQEFEAELDRAGG